MKIHFEQEMDNLRKMITTQATLVEKAVRNSILSISKRSEDLAYFVVVGDDTLDVNEVKIEEECLKVLALHQPVAGDLRMIVTLLKVNTELERIGDLAVNIAERSLHLFSMEKETKQLDFTTMFYEVSAALKNALDSFLCHDCDLAEKVIASDNVIDNLHRENIDRIKMLLKENPNEIESFLDFLTISRNLERIADSCTNIGEDIIYLEQGKIVRHSWNNEKKEQE